MKILVTGTGFVGSNAVRRFIDEGYDVTAVDIQQRDVDFLRPVKEKVKFIRTDVRNVDQMEQVVESENPSAIVHTAIYPASTETFKMFDVNVRGTASILESSRKHDIRVIFVSSGSIYGQKEGKGVITAEEPLGPIFPLRDIDSPWAPGYCVSKRICEEWLSLYHDLYGIEATALRLGWVYGRGEVGRHMNSGIPLLLRKALANEQFHVPYGGDTYCEFVEARDVADAIFRAATTGRIKSLAYNVAYERGYLLKEAAALIMKAIPGSDIELGPGLWPSKDVKIPRGAISWPTERHMDIEKTKSELGYKPVYNLEKGINDYASWLKANWETISPLVVPFPA